MIKRLKQAARRVLPRPDGPVAAFERAHSARFYDLDDTFLVYMDNRFPDSFDQVLRYVSSGFFQPDKMRLVFGHYQANFDSICRQCDEKGIEWFCFGAHRHLPDLSGQLVFYPFNSASNARIVANRTCHHILLLHGESNKPASVKPLARLYDYVLVAGDIACDRLIEGGILTHEDKKRGRIIKMGDTVIGDFRGFEHASETSPIRALGYFPTWEGGNDEENMSSIPVIKPILLSTLERLGLSHLVLRLHPHTAVRLHTYRSDLEDLIQAVLDKGYKVACAVNEYPTQLEYRLKDTYPALDWHQAHISAPKALHSAIVDVSALEAVLDVKQIPNLVYIPPNCPISAPEAYWRLKSGHHLFGPVSAQDVPPIVAATAAYRAALVGYQDAQLADLAPADRMEWLHDYVRENSFWSGTDQTA